MSLTEILSDSIKYPFSDITKFLIVGIIALLAGITSVLGSFGVDNAILNVIGLIIGLIFALMLSGIGLDVVRGAINHSDAIPDIDPMNNIIDGLKVLVISIVYFIIPIIITLLFTGVSGAIGAGLNNIVAALGFAVIIAIIIFIIFAIFQIIALARFAESGKLGDAFSFGEIFEDIKQIGIGKIIALIIIAIIVVAIAAIISSIFALIPFVGSIISSILIGAFVVLFYNRAIGLLYIDA